MLDFTSALYLGLRHSSGALQPWDAFTTGKPAALGEPVEAASVAADLAALVGCERALLAPSTLHLFWDLFGVLARGRAAIYVDRGAYPIAQWGVERAASRGVPARSFPHHDAGALRQMLRCDAWRSCYPVMVTDGWCLACGEAAPLPDYLACARDFGGLVVVDDTQALGILGESPGPAAPYGRGGGGSLRWCRISGPEVIVICSLAKGFGAPLAALCASEPAIRRFESQSQTRVHCSPPSIASLRAAEHALYENRAQGETLRARLARLVLRFRKRLREAGLALEGGFFPVQTLAFPRQVDAADFHTRLLASGIRAVLHRARHVGGVRLSFLITARHSPGEIDSTVQAIASCAAPVPRRIFSQQHSRHSVRRLKENSEVRHAIRS